MRSPPSCSATSLAPNRRSRRRRPSPRRSGDRFSASRIEYVLGILDELSYDPKAAYRHIERSLRLLDELGMHQAVTSQARLLAPLAARCGEPELAAQWRAFVSGRGDAWTHYDGTVLASARNHEGLHARAAGDLDRAADAHAAALEWYTTAGIPSGVAFTESCLGFLAAGRGDHPDSASHHTAALVAATAASDPAALALASGGSRDGTRRPRGAGDAARRRHPPLGRGHAVDRPDAPEGRWRSGRRSTTRDRRRSVHARVRRGCRAGPSSRTHLRPPLGLRSGGCRAAQAQEEEPCPTSLTRSLPGRPDLDRNYRSHSADLAPALALPSGIERRQGLAHSGSTMG